jgi:hypothetical protein
MGLAKSVDGTEYDIDSLLFEMDGVVATAKPIMEQRIVTANRLTKGSNWRDSRWLLRDWDGDMPDWTLVSIENIDKNHKRVHFQPDMEKIWKTSPSKKDSEVNPEEFASVVKELGLTDERLKSLLKDMLLNLFLPKTLKKIERSDQVEFIMDKHWMYLRVDDRGYRV